MPQPAAGWYDDGSGTTRWWDGEQWANPVQQSAPENHPTGFMDGLAAEAEAGAQPHPSQAGSPYVVLQVVLKEKFLGSGSKNLTGLEQVLNQQASLGYRLHTITTASSGTKGLGGGDRIQATLVFERLP